VDPAPLARLGSSVYAFTAMLTTFLLGIAIGSAIISRFADRIRDPFFAFAAVQAMIALGVLAISPLLDRLPVSSSSSSRRWGAPSGSSRSPSSSSA